MATSKFKSDLEKGKAVERLVGQKLKEHYQAAELIQIDNGKDYDFSLNFDGGSVVTFEVKADFMAAKTGNLFFEYFCNGKVSGLSATKANKYVFYLAHTKEALIFCPIEMFSYLQKSNHRNLKGGDRLAVSGYVVPIETIKALDFVQTIVI